MLSLTLLMSVSLPAYAESEYELTISKSEASHAVSDTLYGIDLESISYACDGGLVANLVNNGSFEYEAKNNAGWVYSDKNLYNNIADDTPMNEKNTHYEVLGVDGVETICNIGYPEVYKNKTYEADEEKILLPDMGFQAGESYEFSCYVKNIDFDGTITVYLNSSAYLTSRKNLSEMIQLATDGMNTQNWTKLQAVLECSATEDGTLAIELNGKGSLMLDFVSLVPCSSYGYNSESWKYTSLRSDLFEVIQNLHPSFVRFSSETAQGSWKDTIGPLEERKQNTSAWSDDKNGKYANNTNAMGYHEYLQLCEDLGAQAVPVVGTGISLTIDSDEFTNYKQDVLDLIEYANGDAQTTYWGALRAANGHEQSFGLKYLALEEENAESFKVIYDNVTEKYPDITIVSSANTSAVGGAFQVINGTEEQTGTPVTGSDLLSAIENAGEMTELERSEDGVKMAYYTPLLSKLNAQCTDNSLIWFDSQGIALTPDYYSQLLFFNNTGKKTIDAELKNDKGAVISPSDDGEISQSVTIDEEKQLVYVKLVNTANGKKVKINLDGFENINNASVQTLSHKYETVYNAIGRQGIAPVETVLECSGAFLELELEANSINVIRIAYGDNDGGNFYVLPDTLNLETKTYTPAKVKIAIAAIIVAFALGLAIGFILYLKIIRRKRKR